MWSKLGGEEERVPGVVPYLSVLSVMPRAEIQEGRHLTAVFAPQ